MIVRRAIPDTLPLFVPDAADETVSFQIDAITDWLDSLRTPGILPEQYKRGGNKHGISQQTF